MGRSWARSGSLFWLPLFVDASGDGVLGYRSGAQYLWGPELRSVYREQLAPREPGNGLMGNTLFFRARDIGKPIPYNNGLGRGDSY